MTKNVVLFSAPSEGTRSVQQIVAAAGMAIEWSEHASLDDDARAACRSADAILRGAVATGERTLPLSVELRRMLGLWATVRPVKALPHAPARWPTLDVLCVRETSEDVYSGFEHTVTEGVYEAVKVTTRAATERIARFAFDLARERGRKRVTIVHKANIMKRSDGLFLKAAKEVALAYPEIGCDEIIVDALCMRLVRRPTDFDVLLLGNLFGDIVSDLCAGLAGGGVTAQSASFGSGAPLFDDGGHASADLEPIPLLRAAVWMTRHLGDETAAKRIDTALAAVLAAGVRPIGLGGTASAGEMTKAILSRLS